MTKDATMTMDAAMGKVSDPSYQIFQIWKFIIRPIAIGGMLVSAAFTLFKMRKSLTTGIARSVKDVKKAASGIEHHVPRNEKDISFGWIMVGIALVALLTFCITYFIFDAEPTYPAMLQRL